MRHPSGLEAVGKNRDSKYQRPPTSLPLRLVLPRSHGEAEADRFRWTSIAGSGTTATARTKLADGPTSAPFAVRPPTRPPIVQRNNPPHRALSPPAEKVAARNRIQRRTRRGHGRAVPQGPPCEGTRGETAQVGRPSRRPLPTRHLRVPPVPQMQPLRPRRFPHGRSWRSSREKPT
jgi:hypothetical protein